MKNLQGTEKQVKWAESIREDLIARGCPEATTETDSRWFIGHKEWQHGQEFNTHSRYLEKNFNRPDEWEFHQTAKIEAQRLWTPHRRALRKQIKTDFPQARRGEIFDTIREAREAAEQHYPTMPEGANELTAKLVRQLVRDYLVNNHTKNLREQLWGKK